MHSITKAVATGAAAADPPAIALLAPSAGRRTGAVGGAIGGDGDPVPDHRIAVVAPIFHKARRLRYP